jgi:hypothetical protein
MTDQGKAVIIVYATSHAMYLEKLLKGAEVSCKMIPVPRHISSDCGVCLQIGRADIKAADQVVQTAGLTIQGIYPV